jgi:predicted amidohydrolase
MDVPRQCWPVAAIQFCAGADKARNLEMASQLIGEACSSGARLVVLPEMFNILGSADVLRAGAEPLDGPTCAWAAEHARTHRIWLVAGSFMERTSENTRSHNTCCLFDPEGRRRAVYRKIHLFDVDVPGATLRESDAVLSGHDIVTADIDGIRIGFAICYDLRFPELFRILALQGVRVVVLPSAFFERTGRDHWEVLLRARAIENQLYVIAANQVGATSPKLRWFGRSMIIDPWGTVLAQAPDRPCVVTAHLDFTAQDQLRAELPSLANRRPDAYLWPAPPPASPL